MCFLRGTKLSAEHFGILVLLSNIMLNNFIFFLSITHKAKSIATWRKYSDSRVTMDLENIYIFF